MAIKDINLGSSAFFILMIFVALGSLAYLGIWSYQPTNNSIRGVIIFTIFFSLIISAILFSKFQIFNEGSWKLNCTNFFWGFVIWLGAGSFFGTKSILSLSANNMYASIAGELPQMLEFLTNSFIIPIAEELFWMVTIPYAVISMLNLISRGSIMGLSLEFFENKWFQIIVVAIISASTFAAFHVGKLFIGFIIAAIIFRAIQIILLFGDEAFDIIPFLKVTIAFNIGAHIGNNFVNFGILKGWAILTSNLMPVGLIVIILFVAILGTGLSTIVEFINDKFVKV